MKLEQNSLTQVNTDKPTKKFTMKQRKWLKLYTELGNATEAAMRVYNCKGNRETAAQIGYENIRKLDFTELMDAKGMTDDFLLDQVNEGMTKAGRVAKINGKQGVIPDYATRHKYVETALKLKKKLSDTQKVELTGKDGGPIKFNLVAGIGFLPDERKEVIIDEGDNISRSDKDDATPDGSSLEGQPQIQSPDLA